MSAHQQVRSKLELKIDRSVKTMWPEHWVVSTLPVMGFSIFISHATLRSRKRGSGVWQKYCDTWHTEKSADLIFRRQDHMTLFPRCVLLSYFHEASFFWSIFFCLHIEVNALYLPSEVLKLKNFCSRTTPSLTPHLLTHLLDACYNNK